MKINNLILKEKAFIKISYLLSKSLTHSLRRWKEIRVENVSVNIRGFNSKG